MAGFDRSKFKGAKLSANKDSQRSAQENNKSFNREGGRLGFLEIKEGKNVFRILPPHPDDTIGAAYLPKRVAMLKCESEVWQDGEKTNKTEIKNKNIFIATQHGGLPNDPIELYINYVRKRANDEIQDKEERQKFLAPITGWKGKDGKWNWGINPKTSFVCYAVGEGKVGRLELYESMIKDMDKLAISEEPEDVMAIDPFSDPNEGCELIITKQHEVDKQGKATNKWEYPISKGEPSRQKRESWDDYFERTMVTDAQLEELLKQEPLSKIQGNDVYSTRDWNFALDGLRRFDEENKYGIFDNDEFLEELVELEKLVPEEKRDDKDIENAFPDKKKEEAVSEKAPEKVIEVSKETDEDAVTPLEMKIVLKRFIKKEFGEEFIAQLPTDTSELSKWYCLYEEGEDLPIKTKKELKEDKKAETKGFEVTTSQLPEVLEQKTISTEGAVEEDKLSSQIQALRNKRRGNV